MASARPPAGRAWAAVLAAAWLLQGCAAEPDEGCTAITADLRPLVGAEWSNVPSSSSLIGALRAVRLAIERQLVAHDEWVALGWCEYRAEQFDAAEAAFTEATRRVRHSTDATLGLGFIALRRDDPGAAVDWFSAALARDPGAAEPAEGLALAAERLPPGDPAAGALALAAERILEQRPGDAEWLFIRATALRKAGRGGELRLRPDRGSERPRYFARAGTDYLEVRGADGQWRPLYVKGVNIGPALPGRYPSEAPQDEATWESWLQDIAGIGANAVRVYTLQPPAFYRALARHNAGPEERRLWLLQGVWAELPPGDDFDDPTYLDSFHAEIARVIDAVHGDLVLSRARGHAQGVYDADVSAYTLAWIIGREWEPFAVVAYDAMNPGRCDHAGRFVAVAGGGAMECWIGRSLDFAAAYEARRHGTGRPLTFANWPTLDPLHHRSEANRAEEDQWRLQLEGIPLPPRAAPAWDDDAISVDATLLSGTRDFGPGVFASYHVYPNFPYFMNLEPAFAAATDAEGVNRYLGYLRALKAYHGDQPVLVAEFGMSTSRGIAHLQPEGLHHGGQHEPEAMRQVARLARSIHDADMAGGLVFAFMDEWFKGTWSTSPFELPEDHRAFWFNAESPEQSYGLWAARPAAPVSMTGRAADWSEIPPLQQREPQPQDGGWRQLRRLKATMDAGYLYVLLQTAGTGTPDWSRLALALGIDSYDAQRGERALPAPMDCSTATGVEFLVRLQGPDDSVLQVTPPYLPRHPAESGAAATMFSPLTATGRFETPKLTTNRQRYTRDGEKIPAQQVALGQLRFGSLDPGSPLFDTRSDVVVDADAGRIELRLPWALLNFADPSAGKVLHQPVAGGALATQATEGLRLYACAWDPTAPELNSRLPAAAEVAPLLAAPGWSQPDYELEPKHGLPQVTEALRQLPGGPRPRRPDPEETP
jgi:tetratricopeptide (TPR) repeat protein